MQHSVFISYRDKTRLQGVMILRGKEGKVFKDQSYITESYTVFYVLKNVLNKI